MSQNACPLQVAQDLQDIRALANELSEDVCVCVCSCTCVCVTVCLCVCVSVCACLSKYVHTFSMRMFLCLHLCGHKLCLNNCMYMLVRTLHSLHSTIFLLVVLTVHSIEHSPLCFCMVCFLFVCVCVCSW